LRLVPRGTTLVWNFRFQIAFHRMVRKRRPRKAAKIVDRDEDPAWVGAAWMGLALLVMVAVVGAVYWSNPKDNSQNAVSGVQSRETTGSGTYGAGQR
jgi:hypothetical protein